MTAGTPGTEDVDNGNVHQKYANHRKIAHVCFVSNLYKLIEGTHPVRDTTELSNFQITSFITTHKSQKYKIKIKNSEKPVFYLL